MEGRKPIVKGGKSKEEEKIEYPEEQFPYEEEGKGPSQW
jgi:hypothetical protein